MNKIYFMERLAELSHIAILVYNKKTEQVVQQYGYVEKMQELFENDKDVLFHMSDENIKEYPLICAVNENQLIGVIWDKTSDEEVILAGPVKIGMTRLEAFVSCILLLFAQITGKELTLAEFWEGNKEQYQKVGQIQERISEDIFIRQENFGPHNPYEKELRELDSIRNGDKESLRKSLSETYEGEYGILAKNPLRQHQNLAIIEIAFASRAAIQGGVSVEKSFSMTDSFVQQIEEMDNIQEVEILKLEAQYALRLLFRKNRFMENNTQRGIR